MKESEKENKVIEVKENTTMEKYIYKQDNTKSISGLLSQVQFMHRRCGIIFTK